MQVEKVFDTLAPVIQKKRIVMHQLISHRYMAWFGRGIPLGARESVLLSLVLVKAL